MDNFNIIISKSTKWHNRIKNPSSLVLMPRVIILKTIFIFQLWSPNLLAYNSKKCIEPTFPFWINNMVVQNYIWTLLEHSCIWNILSYLHVHSFMELRIKLHLTSLHNVNISNVILYHSTSVPKNPHCAGARSIPVLYGCCKH